MTLPRSLRDPALVPLWRAVHSRLSSGRAVSRVRIGPLDDDQRVAVADLLGMDRTPGERMTVALSQLDAVLTESVGRDTRAVVAELVGPLDDRSQRRAQVRAQREQLRSWLAGHEVVRAQPALLDWVDQLRIGAPVPDTRRNLDDALRVLGRLPVEGLPLPSLADEVVGDPHALDDGTRLSGLVLRALAAIYATGEPSGAEQRRALWQRAGVADDELTSVVVAAGLRPVGECLVSQVSRACASSGQAAALTLAQLRATSSLSIPGTDVWVVENPSVLALAVRRFQAGCPPMVCTSGWPNSAGILLLRQLARGGARLRYHGDFDGEGLRIAAYVMAKTGATAWRMSTSDYVAAASGNLPTGRLTPAPWDADLAEAMRTHDAAVPEERVAETLLADLAQA